MITWRNGRVVALGRRWDGALELTVDVTPQGPVRALAYPGLVGEPQVDDTVVLNTTALDRGLGTGGYALVIAVLPAGPSESAVPSEPAATGDATLPDEATVVDDAAPALLPRPGHLVKARYTPLQTMVLGVDEQESPHHGLLEDADDLAGMPVVVADLHSALPAVLAGARLAAEHAGLPVPRIAYVMTDGGALPAWFSRTVAGLRDAGWLSSCITVGQAFGGDLEAVTLHTGLLAARLVDEAALVVVAQGPGNLGTGTRWGFSGVAAGEAINAASTLGGRPVASLRISGADARARHLGVSHHSLTAYGRVALRPADVVVPVLATAPTAFAATDQDAAALDALVADQVAPLATTDAAHRLVTVEATDALHEALAATPVGLSTMGRPLAADPAAFLAAGVAGAHAVALLAGGA